MSLKFNTMKSPLIIFLLCFPLLASCQTVLERDGVVIFEDEKNTVTKATIQTETETTVSIQVEFTGFKDKKYKIKGVFLDKLKRPMKELEPFVADLDARSGLADLFFAFKQVKTRTYSQPTLESKYFKVIITDKDDPFGDMDLDIGLGNNYLFKCKKKWKVKPVGASQAVVAVRLVPYKSAATIRQITN
jgi:hypothetical protein